MRARLATLILAAGLSLGGCAYGGLGSGVSVSTGYGDPYGYGPYGNRYGYGGYGSPYGYGGYGGRYGGFGYDPFGRYNPYYRSPYYGSPYYGSPYMGWYDGFYYPGSGYYVYDRDRNRRRLSEVERRRWMQGIAEAAANAARNGQTSGSTSTRSTSRMITPSSRNVRSRDESLVQSIRARAEARQNQRRTTTRSNSNSKSLATTLRRRIKSED